jgi:ribosome-binding factor A
MSGKFESFQKPNHRKPRVERVIGEVISELLLRNKIKDPMLSGRMLTVTEVVCSDDLRHATVYYSCLDTQKPEAPVIDQLQKTFRRAAPFVRSVVSQNLSLYKAPELKFVFDEDLHQGERVLDQIRSLQTGSGETSTAPA